MTSSVLPPLPLEMLDLYDISLLLNYERATTEPRFRFAKLREVATPGTELNTVDFVRDDLFTDSSRAKTQFVYDRPMEYAGTKSYIPGPPDTPKNILPTSLSSSDPLADVSWQGLETFFWQTRGHDACYNSVILLQHFFDLYPPETPIRIRHGPGKGKGRVSVTQIRNRFIVELGLVNPKHTLIALVSPENQAYLSGENVVMKHAILEFSETGRKGAEGAAMLDLSSMQFGDVGRGPGVKGKATFALDTSEEFRDRLNMVAEGIDPSFRRVSRRIGPCQWDNWLRDVAGRVKARWDRRESEKWCGHCGAPVPVERTCGGCRNAWFCDKNHQRAAWVFHKLACRQL
ncbi:hypothetical protein DL96DRAFT_1576709 [Flagelloscypha sp. PMI_526]|nr:hypothetical protein DL96DRAFT_1576709 [Flagelloscypha sp. PMI_526]